MVVDENEKTRRTARQSECPDSWLLFQSLGRRRTEVCLDCVRRLRPDGGAGAPGRHGRNADARSAETP